MDKIFKGFTSNVVKDIDSKQGIVTGYFSVFGNVDSDGDMIMPGSFTKTIKENGPEGKNRVMHLWQHNPSEPIGKPHVLKEDSYGLYFESKLADTARGADTLKLYDAGIINEHSIGFNTVKKEQKGTYVEIQEIKLWEGSTVTWGANEMTYTTGIKGLFKSEGATDVFEYRQKLYKAIYDGKYSDETFLLLIEQLEVLDNELKSLFAQEKATEPTVEVTQPVISEKDTLLIELITKNFNGI
jgi:HK97 family phage prohead protease